MIEDTTIWFATFGISAFTVWFFCQFSKQTSKTKSHPKLQRLKEADNSKIQVVFDFDQTLTAYWSEPTVRNKTCHGCLPAALNDEFKKEEKRLLGIYYPIEIDPNIELKEKTKKMEEWWGTVHDLAIKHKLKRDDLKQAVYDSQIKMRPYAKETLQLLSKHNIPVLVMSAGIADVVSIRLEQDGLLTPNVAVISNKCQWNDSGVLCGFGELITSCNKNGCGELTSPYWQKQSDRPFAICVGESDGDVDMTKGVEYLDLIYNVGYLNKKIQERLNGFQKLYDTVYLDDHTMKDFYDHLVDIIDS